MLRDRQAPIIPPSILFIIYGVLTGQSITRLFVAGAVPGVAYGLGFMIVAYFRHLQEAQLPAACALPASRKSW